MELLEPILWTLVLGIEIGFAIMGHAPTWTMVLCPLISLVVIEWLQFFDDDDFI